jgi:hypothetical protein
MLPEIFWNPIAIYFKSPFYIAICKWLYNLLTSSFNKVTTNANNSLQAIYRKQCKDDFLFILYNMIKAKDIDD